MQNTTKRPTHFVGVGASAGGLEAIEAFFKTMPVDTGLAFIVLQHLSPDYKSLMSELLSKRTAIPVHAASDGVEVLPDTIYLIPPKKDLRIFHGKLLLSNQDRSGALNLPIDIFLRSLAEDQGEKSIAVILSGTGSDGTRGCRAIKEYGGMVMVQSEVSAKFDGMPKSVVSSGMADFILTPEEMPAQLQAYTRHPYASRSDSIQAGLADESDLSRAFSLLRERTKIDFTFYKPTTIMRRIERRMSVTHHHDLREYVRHLETHPSEISVLFKELLIGVTNFFRDPDAFSQLADHVLPDIIERSVNREIRVWVAGCSTGEEAYTLAILFRETMEQLGKYVDVKIFATDVDQDAIEVASAGVYPGGVAADIPKQLLAKYFTQREDRFQVARSIREMVVFAQHNLVKDPPFTNIELISCRNLLIYLQPVLQRKALEYFNFSLASKGYLLLGLSETTGEMGDYFDVVHQKFKVYQSRGKRKPTNIAAEPGNFERVRSIRSRLSGLQTATRLQYEDELVLDRFLQAFAGDYVRLAFVVNSNGELIHVIGDTTGYMKVQPGVMTNDAAKMIAKELAIPFSTGLQKCLKKNETLTFTQIRVNLPDCTVMVQMRLKPLVQRKGQDPLVGVFLSEMKGRKGESGVPEGVSFDVSKEAEQRINDLEQELQFTRENLQATVEELETSNEELQATNEELLASNEELQSTNEELQSVNEELYTVNAEHQSKITELTELTNDLDNLMESTEIGTLFLDENFEIRRFSDRITRVFHIIESDIGRPIGHISTRLDDIDLEATMKQVMRSHRKRELEVRLDDGLFLMRILPYRISSEVYTGIVILLIDVSELKTQPGSAADGLISG